MAYIEVKKFEVNKGGSESLIDGFVNRSIARDQDGFVNLSVGINTRHDSYDVVVLTFTWRDEAAYMAFKTGDAHLQSHKTRPKNPNIIKYASFHYTVLI